MQPNAIFSAPVGAPPTALKATKPPVQSPGDAGKTNDIRPDRKEASPFARLISDKSSTSDVRSTDTARTTKADKPADTPKETVVAEEATAETAQPVVTEAAEAAPTESTDVALPETGVIAGTVEETGAAIIDETAVSTTATATTGGNVAAPDAEDQAEVAAANTISAPARAAIDAASIKGDDAEVVAPIAERAARQQAATLPGADANGASPDAATAATDPAGTVPSPAVSEEAPAPLKADAPRVDLASAARQDNATAPAAQASDRPTVSAVAPDATGKAADVASVVTEAQVKGPAQAALHPTVAAVAAPPADLAQQTAVPTTAPVQTVQATVPAQTLATAAPQAMVPDAPVQQLAVHVTRAAKEGADRIEIQLKPAELGRVDVKMEVGHDGRVMAVVSAERPETLDMLRRDVQQLERALTHAGFNTDRESFSFAERGGEGGQQANGDGHGSGSGNAAGTEAMDETENPTRRRMAFDKPGVDVKV